MEENNNVEVLDDTVKTEVKVEQPKKKSPIGIIILVIILMVGCLVGGYFISEKGLLSSKEEPETKEVNKKEEKKEELDVNDPLVVNLFNVFRLDTTCWMSVDGLNNDNKVKLRLAYENLGYNSKFESLPCSEFGAFIDNRHCGQIDWANQELSNAYTNNQELFKKLVEEKVYTKVVKQNDLKAKTIELFGSDFNYKDEDFGLGHMVDTSCSVMHYFENKKVYAMYNCEGGGTCPGVSQEINKVYKQGNKLFIETTTTAIDNKKENANYEFKKDSKYGNYVFVKVTK